MPAILDFDVLSSEELVEERSVTLLLLLSDFFSVEKAFTRVDFKVDDAIRIDPFDLLGFISLVYAWQVMLYK